MRSGLHEMRLSACGPQHRRSRGAGIRVRAASAWSRGWMATDTRHPPMLVPPAL